MGEKITYTKGYTPLNKISKNKIPTFTDKHLNIIKIKYNRISPSKLKG